MMARGFTGICAAIAAIVLIASASARSQERIARAQEGGETLAAPAKPAASLTAKITSPMGRTGEPGSVRIVAQIRATPDAVLSPVQFFVDGKLLATVESGPPYAAEWVDENPFEKTEIAVAVADSLGNTARDTVVLKAFEISDATEVSRVLLDTSVQDKTGKFVRNL